jgi:hypothetical protein
MTESTIQHSIIQYLQLRRVFAFSVPNEGHGGQRHRALHMKALGQRNGVSDIIALLPSRAIFLEVKTDTGRQSPAQHDFEETVKSLGFEYYVVRSVEDVARIFE